SAARKSWEGARRHFVVEAGHFNGLSGGEIVEGEIDGTAAIVPGAFGRISDEDAAFGWRGVPENFGDVPGAVGVVDEDAVAERLEFAKNAEEGFGGGTLKESAGLGIDGRGEEIVGMRITDIQVERGIESDELD